MLGFMSAALIVLLTPLLIALLPVIVPTFLGLLIAGGPTILTTLLQEFANADWDLVAELFNNFVNSF